jgi:hypothetical protein
LPAASSSQIFFGSTTTPNATISQNASDNINLTYGAHWNGSAWVADNGTAFIEGINGAFTFYESTGLTVGSTFTPTLISAMTASGLNVPALTIAGAALGGSCSGGQFVNTINPAGVPSCATPATGGSGYPSGAPPQIGGFSATNTAEAETLGGDATLTRSGANAYSISVTKSGGTALTSLFAPLTNAAGGSGNYAPIASPVFTTTATSPTLLLTSASTQIFFGSTTTPEAALTANTADSLTVSAGAHYNGTNWIADATTAQSQNYTPSGFGFYMNSGLTVGSSYTSTAIASLGTTGFNLPTGETYQVNGVPIGATGPAGPTGPQGNPGPTGATGPIGPTGTPGATGTQGATGPTGATGPIGPTGTPGPAGTQGATGPAGPAPSGAPPQIVGYSGTNTVEADTVSGDATLSRASAGSYTIAVTKTGGVAFTGLATAAIPLSIANGGRGSSTALVAGQIDIAQSATAFAGVAMSGDATITSAGAISVAKTGGVAFSALATATVPLSIANGGSGSATAPTAGQIRVAASATSFPPVSMSGDATIASTGAVTVTKLNGTTPGGTCSAGNFVSTISASGVPTCTTPATGGAPTTNPAGGQNNYAPLASPTFTGTVTGPTLNLTTTTATQIFLGSSTTPEGTVSALSGSNINLAGGAHNNGTNWIADSTVAGIVTAAGAGINFYQDTGLTVGNTFTPTQVAGFNGNGLVLNNTTSTQIFIGSATTPEAALTANATDAFNISAGMHYNGTNWIADATAAQFQNFNANGFGFYMNTGLTVGSTFTPTEVAMLNGGGIYFNVPPSTAWEMNQAANTVTVATGSNYPLAVAAGMIVITDTSVSGTTAIYICGGGTCSMVSTTGATFVASTTTPASGKTSVASNGTKYTIYNNQGSSVIYGLFLVETRNTL